MISVSPIEESDEGHGQGERNFTSSTSESRTRLVSQGNRCPTCHTDGDRGPGIAGTESSGSSSGAGPSEYLIRGDVKRELDLKGSSLLYPPAMTFDGGLNPRLVSSNSFPPYRRTPFPY